MNNVHPFQRTVRLYAQNQNLPRKYLENFLRAVASDLQALRPGRPAGRFEHPETKIGNPTAMHGSG
ncbi:MAG: hypothetical protein ABSD57_06920 [Verrucomicrobiota bacterium]|jgi:hypothetical protein